MISASRNAQWFPAQRTACSGGAKQQLKQSKMKEALIEVLQGNILALQAWEERAGWFGRQLSFLWSLSLSCMGSRLPQHAELGFTEIVQLRVVLINKRAD